MNFYNITSETSKERGIEYGRKAKFLIHQFLDDDLTQLNTLRKTPLDQNCMYAYASDFYMAIAEDLPEIAEEIMGIAEGADIRLEEATLLQIRREMTALSGEDCTLLGLNHPTHGPILAQTIDLSGALENHMQVVKYHHATCAQSTILMCSYTGLLGYMGMNDHGLSIGINMVLAEPWRIGVPPYLLVRYLLTMDNVDQALDAITGIKLASSRCLTLFDKDRFVSLEMTPDDDRKIEINPLIHTNHFLHPDLMPHDKIDPNVSSSFIRFTYLQKIITKSPHPTIEQIKNLLSSHEHEPFSICAHSDEFTHGKTVAAAIAIPRSQLLEICLGTPCNKPWFKIKLD